MKAPARVLRRIDCALPGLEFLHCETAAFASLFKRDEAAIDGGYDLGLAPENPAFGAPRGKVGLGEHGARRADDIGNRIKTARFHTYLPEGGAGGTAC